MNQRSSVIAAAATLLAIDENLTRQGLETNINSFADGILNIVSLEFLKIINCLIMFWKSPDGILMQQEDVYRCYKRMQELSADKTNLVPDNPASSSTPIRLIEPNAYENSLGTPVTKTRRKRLEFRECDQD